MSKYIVSLEEDPKTGELILPILGEVYKIAIKNMG